MPANPCPWTDPGWFDEAAAVLSDSGFPDTLEHNDLHLDNAFDVDGRLRLFDVGDCLLAHPFGVLRVPLHDALRRGCSARELDRIRDAYFEPWESHLSRTDPGRVPDAAVRVGGIGRWESWRRCRPGCRPRGAGSSARTWQHCSPRSVTRSTRSPTPDTGWRTVR